MVHKRECCAKSTRISRMRTGRSSMTETSKLNGQRSCLLKNMNSRIELMRSAVEGMEFVFCYFVATLCISLQARRARLPFL